MKRRDFVKYTAGSSTLFALVPSQVFGAPAGKTIEKNVLLPVDNKKAL